MTIVVAGHPISETDIEREAKWLAEQGQTYAALLIRELWRWNQGAEWLTVQVEQPAPGNVFAFGKLSLNANGESQWQVGIGGFDIAGNMMPPIFSEDTPQGYTHWFKLPGIPAIMEAGHA